jgi:hypothetical protein
VTAAGARAQELPNPPWWSALPPRPVPASVQPYGVPHCRTPGMRCIHSLERRLRRQWTALDAACDHRATFSLAYLRITEGLEHMIRAGGLRDPHWMETVIADFSNHYFRSFADYAAGRPVPESWRIAYDEAMHGDASAPQDVLLASNAHTQHDLPFIYAEQGMVTPDGASHKPDHDAVNAVNESVFRGIEDYGAQHYDPQFATFELMPLQLDKWGTLQAIQGWREGAWRNAERLITARSPQERAAVVASIDANANAWARLITTGDQPGYRATRDAFCAAHH